MSNTNKFIKFQYLFKKVFIYEDSIEIKTSLKSESIKKSQIKSTSITMLGSRLKIYVDSNNTFDIDLPDKNKIKDLSDYINDHITFKEMAQKYNNIDQENSKINDPKNNSFGIHSFGRLSAKIVGSILLFFGFISLFTSFWPAFFILLSGLIIFPKTYALIAKKSKINLTKQIRIASALFLIIISTVIIGFNSSDINSVDPLVQSKIIENVVEENIEPAQIKNNLGIGDVGILNNNDDPSDCSGTTIVSSTKETYNEFLDSYNANDTYGYLEMIDLGKIALIPNCKKIRVIDSSFAMREFRFIEDQSVTAWAPYEYTISE